jgi:hypothetical protein
MHRILLAAALAAFAAPAAASDESDIAAVVKGYNTSFAPSYCAPQAAIIDEFAPHSWIGATACADWVKSFDADAKANGITDGLVTPGKPEHVKVAGDRAYAVYPAHYDFKVKGKPVHETGTWTFAFQKLAGGWKITAWTWSQH